MSSARVAKSSPPKRGQRTIVGERNRSTVPDSCLVRAIFTSRHCACPGQSVADCLRGFAVAPSREAARPHSRGRSRGRRRVRDRSACSLLVSIAPSRAYVWSPKRWCPSGRADRESTSTSRCRVSARRPKCWRMSPFPRSGCSPRHAHTGRRGTRPRSEPTRGRHAATSCPLTPSREMPPGSAIGCSIDALGWVLIGQAKMLE